MKLIRILVFILLIVYFGTPQTSAYLGGIEDGDKVNLDYILSYDDEVQQNGPGFETYVTDSAIIQGFYEGLLGMTVGQQKNIVVPIGKGYPPSHNLGDKILYFDVTINKILENVRGDNYIAPSPELVPFEFGAVKNTGSAFEDLFASPIFLAISLTVIIGFFYIKSTGSTSKVSNAKKSTKMSAKERVQKRMEEVDQSDF